MQDIPPEFDGLAAAAGAADIYADQVGDALAAAYEVLGEFAGDVAQGGGAAAVEVSAGFAGTGGGAAAGGENEGYVAGALVAVD